MDKTTPRPWHSDKGDCTCDLYSPSGERICYELFFRPIPFWRHLFFRQGKVTIGGFSLSPALAIKNMSDAPIAKIRTPGPWKISEQIKEQSKDQSHRHSFFIASEYMRNGWPYYQDCYVAAVQDKDNAEFIVRAVNSFEESQKTIAALVEAAKKVLNKHESDAIAANFRRCGCDTCAVLKPALAHEVGK